MTLGKLLNLSLPWFPHLFHLPNLDKMNSDLVGWLKGSKCIILYVKCLELPGLLMIIIIITLVL